MARFHYRCIECAEEYREDPNRYVCSRCGGEQEPGGAIRGVLEVVLKVLPSAWPHFRPSDREFLHAFLPITDDGALPPLPVGDTPLLEAPRLRDELEMPNLFLKDDTRNPSGSTKDRASLLVVAKAVEYGCDTVATASTGNAASALTAVAASAGVRAIVFVPASAPPAKLTQMQSYGGIVVSTPSRSRARRPRPSKLRRPWNPTSPTPSSCRPETESSLLGSQRDFAISNGAD
jgi:threonine synthase